MEENKILDTKIYLEGYKNITNTINSLDVEDRTLQIEELKKEIEKLEKDGEDYEKNSSIYDNKQEKKKRTEEMVSEIANKEKKIEELKQKNKEVQKNIEHKKMLEERKQTVKINAKNERDKKLIDVKKEIADLKEKQKEELSKVSSSEEMIKLQLKDIEKEEELNPNKVRDSKYKEFLQKKIEKLRENYKEFEKQSEAKISSLNGKISQINKEYQVFLQNIIRLDNGIEMPKEIEEDTMQDRRNKKSKQEKNIKTKTEKANEKKESDYNSLDEVIKESEIKDGEELIGEREKDSEEDKYRRSLDKVLAGIKMPRSITENRETYTYEPDDMNDENENAENSIYDDTYEPDDMNDENENVENSIYDDTYEPDDMNDENENAENSIYDDTYEPDDMNDENENAENNIDEETKIKEDSKDTTNLLYRIYISPLVNKVYRDGTKHTETFRFDEEFRLGKKILKSKEFKNKCKRISGNSIKFLLLKRKLNPIILSILNKEENIEYLEDYINTINGKGSLGYSIVENLRGKSAYKNMSFFDKRLIKRVARNEDKIKDFTVYMDEEKKIKRLASGLKKIKRPKKFKSKKLYRGKSIVRKTISLAKGIRKRGNNFFDRIQVNNKDNRIEKQAIINNEEKMKERKEYIKEFEEEELD